MREESDAVRKEREMREHEAEARKRDSDEQDPTEDVASDPGATEPAPPGNIQRGGPGG
jgi:hypothetical protein